MTWIKMPCLFCGDPCDVTPNGSICIDCDVYAYQQANGRWMVYLPSEEVPRQEVCNRDGSIADQCSEYVCRCT